MPRTFRTPGLGRLAAVLLGLTTGTASAADQATVRGQINAVDPAARAVTVRTAPGADLSLTADAQTRLAIGGKPVTLDQFRPGQRVRATYEKAGAVNRLVALRTTVPTEADLARDVRAALDSARGYTFAQKDEYQQKLRSVVDDVDDRLDDLQNRAKDATGDARTKLDAQIKNLQQTRDSVEKRLAQAKPAAADAWDEFKAGVGAAADDLHRAVDRLRDDPKSK